MLNSLSKLSKFTNFKFFFIDDYSGNEHFHVGVKKWLKIVFLLLKITQCRQKFALKSLNSQLSTTTHSIELQKLSMESQELSRASFSPTNQKFPLATQNRESFHDKVRAITSHHQMIICRVLRVAEIEQLCAHLLNFHSFSLWPALLCIFSRITEQHTQLFMMHEIVKECNESTWAAEDFV